MTAALRISDDQFVARLARGAKGPNSDEFRNRFPATSKRSIHLLQERPETMTAHRDRFLRTTVRLAICLGLLWLAAVSPASLAAQPAAQQTGFVDRVFQDDQGDHKYTVFVPASYSPEKKWPVMLFLHGAGERGNDGKLQLSVGLAPIVKAQAKTFPYVVVFPQCEDTTGRVKGGWLADSVNGQRALKILDEVEQTYQIDQDREVLTGWSMGGYGAWSIAAAYPQRFEAVVPLSGGGDPATAGKLKSVPLWAFHGEKDEIVAPAESRKMIEAIKQAGGSPNYTEVPGVGHSVWTVVYQQPELYRWLQNPQSAPSAAPRFLAKPGQFPVTSADLNAPFIPALEIPRAVYVRLGNQMLEALADSVPQITPKDTLMGNINDIYDSTVVEGRSFSIVFSQISYSGELSQARLKAQKANRLTVQLGLSNVTLTIGASYVNGAGKSAQAGPISIVIGYQRPVWLSFDVEPFVDQKQIRLKLLSTSFDIPQDNWYVSSPAGVWTRGIGMTSQRVSSGLVNGLYGSKGRIESEVRAVVPSLLEELEGHLKFDEINNLVTGFWPLPVYRPRVKLWPESIATDDNGVSVSFGVTVAALDESRAPDRPEVLPALGPSADQVQRDDRLQIGIVPEIIRPLTEMLVDGDVARIHVADIPDNTFADFLDAKVLAKSIPELKRYGDKLEIWAEVVLTGSLSVKGAKAKQPLSSLDPAGVHAAAIKPVSWKSIDVPQDKEGADREVIGDPLRLMFDAPQVTISLAIKPADSKDKWIPFAELDVSLNQSGQAVLLQPSYQTRMLRLDWSGSPQVKVNARFAAGYQAENRDIDQRQLADLFLKCWLTWTTSRPASETKIDDIDFGYTKLRLAAIDWKAPHLLASFETPRTRLTNKTDKPIKYELKGPYSAWGGPYTIEPGRSQDFAVAYPVLFRREYDGGTEFYQLPVGTQSEFLVKAPNKSARLYMVLEKPAEQAEPQPDAKPQAN